MPANKQTITRTMRSTESSTAEAFGSAFSKFARSVTIPACAGIAPSLVALVSPAFSLVEDR